jgi:hypothetical protein
MCKIVVGLLMACLVLSCSPTRQNLGSKASGLVSFASPWTSVFRVDPSHPHQLVNNEGEHLLILNKTAWAYFTSADPEGVLQRAKAQGVNVIRVCLEGTPYFDVLKMDAWPWGGTRPSPDYSAFNETYWDEVERRIRLAGEYGIGIDLNLYFTLRKDAEKLANQQEYWACAIQRLGKYSNVLTWEIMNEYLGSESFQDSVGLYFYKNDPWQRPVITSDGTTDDAAWPQKEWMGMAVVHTCTGSTENHSLYDWYLAVARNTRSHGKPAFNNESGREIRHKNDDPIHRRKQAWIWYAAGCHWTWHSWEGCEGIDDAGYRGPGQEFMLPVTTFFRSLPFWKMDPNFTVFNLKSSDCFSVALAGPSRETNIVYLCTHKSGVQVPNSNAKVRLPNGIYRISFIEPATLNVTQTTELKSTGLGRLNDLEIPAFTDDLVVKIEQIEKKGRTVIKGTE